MKLKKDKKLEKIAKDVKYEIYMFRLTTEHLYCYSNKASTNEKVKDSHFLINFLLESFAIHAYNLYKFFYQGEREKKNNRQINRKSSDVIAEDFHIRRRFFRNNRTPKWKLKIIENKRNKQIAHLTYNRIYRNKRTKPWNFGLISRYMEKTIEAFIKSLPAKHNRLFNQNQR
jgi:hypothetical protein